MVKTSSYISFLTNTLSYQFKFNQVTNQIEANGEPLTDMLEAKILADMLQLGYGNQTQIRTVIKALAGQNTYDPIKDYFNSLQWDGVDYIGLLTKHFTDNHAEDYKAIFNKTTYEGNEVFTLWLRKFLIGAVTKIQDVESQNPILVLDGSQELGKSTFAKWLASPLSKFFHSGPIIPDIKDCKLRLGSAFIWEAGELGVSLRKADREALKHFLTLSEFKERVPYGRYDIEVRARASFIGTVNTENSGLLSDPTGNRRFHICQLKKIEWEYQRNLLPDLLWAQAVACYNDDPISYKLDKQEAQLRDLINTQFETISPIDDIIDRYYEVTNDLTDYVRSDEILEKLTLVGFGLKNSGLARELATVMTRLKIKSKRQNVDIVTQTNQTITVKATCYLGIRTR